MLQAEVIRVVSQLQHCFKMNLNMLRNMVQFRTFLELSLELPSLNPQQTERLTTEGEEYAQGPSEADNM